MGEAGKASDAVVLGIDGGGSKTLIALADATGRVRRMERGAGVNPLDTRDWQQVLTGMLRPFAGGHRIAGVAAALPVFGEVAAISVAQQATIAGLFHTIPQLVLNDVDAAQIGAFGGEAGILILSGTGSMAWARDREGRSHRVGGWGDVIGDEGSSYWIGRRILTVVSQSLDGRTPPTALAGALFQQLGLALAHPVDALEGWVSHLDNPRAEIAALAPLATRFAEAGDAAAIGVIDAAADELALHVTAITRAAGRLPWSYAGGTFAGHALREAVTARIGEAPVQPRLPPIGGALLAAARLAGWPAGADWIARLATSLTTPIRETNDLQPAN